MTGGSGPSRRRRIAGYAPSARKPAAATRGPAAVRPTGPLAVALLALVIVIAVVAVAGYRFLSPSGNPVELPNLIGLPLDAARRSVALAHVDLRVVAHHADDHSAKGNVIGQFPAAGEHVREGRIVDVIVSDGPTIVVVPNLSDMSLRDAEVALGNVRLEVGKVTTQSTNTVAAGRILTQTPDAFSNVPGGSKVDLILAKGKPEVYAPNFVGLSLLFSQSAAKQVGVALAAPVWLQSVPNAKPKGIVVAQDPLPGQPLDTGEKVVLQVSSGPPATPTPFPTLPPEPTETPQSATPQESAPVESSASPGQETRALRVAVQLPQSATPKRVRVALVDATGSHDLYDQMTSGGFTLSFDVTVTGAGTLQTYVDGTLTTSTPL